MAGFLLDAGATITCPHGGQVTVDAARDARQRSAASRRCCVDDVGDDRRLLVQRLRRAVAVPAACSG